MFNNKDYVTSPETESDNKTASRDYFHYKNIQISLNLKENIELINKIFSIYPDLTIREIKISNNPEYSADLIYIDKMIQSDVLEQAIIKKLISKNQCSTYDIYNIDYYKYLLGVNDKSILNHIYEVVDMILNGKIILFVNGIDKAVSIDLKKPPGRGIEEPQVETVIRGPREGFTEDISTNILLLRKIIKSVNLKAEHFVLGEDTKTDVYMMYLSNIANPEIVSELRERVTRIDVNAVLGNSYIKEYIEDEPLSLVPTIFSSERPDVVAAKLLQGRVAVLVDCTPLVITVPAIFSEFMVSTEDFYLNFSYATVNRIVRYSSFILSILLPGLYVAITTFHQELIPTALLVSFIKARSGVPYSSMFECFLMLSVYEILREAGTRMPRSVGQAISVVGALVLGQAAVDAGLVSAPMVIIISVTAVASFAVPSSDLYTAMIVPRIVLLLLGGSLGLLALSTGLLFFAAKLISKRSFGIPYMEPLAPFVKSEFWDFFIRRPLWAKTKRSKMITGKETYKQKVINRYLRVKSSKNSKENKG